MEHQPTHINTQLTTPTATLERSDPLRECKRSMLSCTATQNWFVFKMINVVQLNHAGSTVDELEEFRMNT